MWKLIIGVIAGLLITSNCEAQNQWHHHNGHWHNHYHNSYHYHYGPTIGYQPQVQWYPQGINMNVGPVIVSPCRKYVQFGIYGGYYVPKGYTLYDPRTGQFRYYRR